MKEGKNKLYRPVYTSWMMNHRIPKEKIPKDGCRPETAYDLIHDELALDGNSRLNLATFVQTFGEKQAHQLMSETFDKNMIDKDEYPQTAEMEKRCVSMISGLWNGPVGNKACGCSTIGSSEASMLAGMAAKWRWKIKNKKRRNKKAVPNIVMGANVQVCWEKFARYWEVEPRFVPCQGNRYTMDPAGVLEQVDENTILVVPIMGSTYDGSYEPVEKICQALDHFENKTGIDIDVHIDAASGGFVAPFLSPRLKWDFRLKRVKSIGTSGHKYGLVFPGLGWVIWRDKIYLPEDLIFHCNYLGGDLPNFALNFSRPGSQVVVQYYHFLRLGFSGYRDIHMASRHVAKYLSSNLSKLGPFELVTDGSDLPVFCFRLKRRRKFTYNLYDVADKLREGGWLVPAYTMPKNCQDQIVQRVVVKHGFSIDMADMLLEGFKKVIKYFEKTKDYPSKQKHTSFHH